LPSLSRQGTLSLVATLSILCLVLVAWIIRLTSRSRLFAQYIPHSHYKSMFVHRRHSDEIVCPACLSRGDVVRVVPDGHASKSGLSCPRKECGHYDYPNPPFR
jgi:hypothetical protein